MGRNERVVIRNNVLREIMFRLRENIILILIIVLLAGAAGVVYHKLKKPVYTASEMVNYMAYYDDVKDDPTAANAMNLMNVYVDTVVDFCTSGVVLDRAEYYFSEYVKSGKNIETFVSELKAGNYNSYNPSEITKRQYFNAGSVSSSLLTHGDDTEESYIIVISVDNLNSVTAREMVRIFAYAIDQESRDYFEGVDTYIYELIKDTDGVSVGTSSSMAKNISIFIILGVVLAGLIVYLKSFLDNTAKDKEEIEALTGVSVIAYIDKQENYKGGEF